LFTFRMIIYVECFQAFLRWVILFHCMQLDQRAEWNLLLKLISCKGRVFDECVTQHRLLWISSSSQHSCLDLWIADLEISKQFGSHWIWTYFNSFRNVCHKNFTRQEELWTSTIMHEVYVEKLFGASYIPIRICHYKLK
jgi:hypothetical protein